MTGSVNDTQSQSDNESDISVPRRGRKRNTERNRHDSDSDSDISVDRRRRINNDGLRERINSGSESDVSVPRRGTTERNAEGNRHESDSNSDISVDRRQRGNNNNHQKNKDSVTATDTSFQIRGTDTAAKAIIAQEALKKRKMKELETAIDEYTKGSKQLADEQYEKEQIQAMKKQRFDETFSHVDTKEIQREGDPLAGLSEKVDSGAHVQKVNLSSQSISLLPRIPNRFDLQPGIHWDGINRSNGFEDGLYKAKEALMKRKHQERLYMEGGAQYDYDD